MNEIAQRYGILGIDEMPTFDPFYYIGESYANFFSGMS